MALLMALMMVVAACSGTADETTTTAADSETPDTGGHRLGYSFKSAAEASGLSVPTLYRRAAEGKLRVTKVGRRSIIPASSLRALIEGEAA